MSVLVIVLFCTAVIWLCLKLYFKFTYWEYSNIPRVKTSAISLALAYLLNWRLSQHMMQLYRTCRNEKWPCTGSFLFTRPLLFVASPTLLKEIVVTHSHDFRNRGSYHNNESPEDLNLFNMKDEEWCKWRKIISRSFSTSKYLDTFNVYLQQTLRDLEANDRAQDGIDFFKVSNNYACNIAQFLFLGVNQPDGALPTCEKFSEIFEPNQFNKLTDILSYYCPDLLRFCNASEFPRKPFAYVKKTLKDTMKGSIPEKSFLEKLIHFQTKGELSDENIVGVISALFTGGLKSTTPLLTYACYELAKADAVQEKLRAEIMENLDNNDSVSYECLKKMTYMDCVLNEVMRLHNGGPLLIRECNQTCKLVSLDLTIEKGVLMIASLRGILMDEEYFPNACKFDPDRFENQSSLQSVFYPFGMGRHTCIGEKFALLQAKMFLIGLLSKYKLTVNEKTTNSAEENKRLNEDSIYLNITSI